RISDQIGSAGKSERSTRIGQSATAGCGCRKTGQGEEQTGKTERESEDNARVESAGVRSRLLSHKVYLWLGLVPIHIGIAGSDLVTFKVRSTGGWTDVFMSKM